jgi:integrase
VIVTGILQYAQKFTPKNDTRSIDCTSHDEPTVSSDRDPEAASSRFGMLRGRVSDVRCGTGLVVLWQGEPTAKRQAVLIHDTRKVAAGKLGEIGWHTFRHTYRSWLDETGAPMKVQQELMRHASIQTTMNI